MRVIRQLKKKSTIFTHLCGLTRFSRTLSELGFRETVGGETGGGQRADKTEFALGRMVRKTQPCAPIMICEEFGSRSKIAKVARVESRLNHVVNEGRLPASVARGQLLH